MVAAMPRAGTLVLPFLIVISGLLATIPGALAASVTTEPTSLSTSIVGGSGVLVNGQEIVFGGRDPSGTYQSTIIPYDFLNHTLGNAATLPAASATNSPDTGASNGRYSGTAAMLNGKIYYFGGAVLVQQDINGDGKPEAIPKASRGVIEFDPATHSARYTNDVLPLGAWGMSSVVANGKIYLFGGFTFDITDFASTGRHNWILRFDPSIGEPATSSSARFKQLDSSLPYAVQDAAAAVIGRRVLIMGGLADNNNDTNPCPTYTYVDSNGQEQTKQTTVCLTKRIVSFDADQELALGVSGELPYRAQFITAAVVNGKAYIPGALLSDGTASTSIVEVSLDRSGTPVTRVLTPSLPRGAFGQAVATDGKTILIAGGRYGSDKQLLSDILRLDPGPTPPWAPRSPVATEISGGVKLSWDPPSYNGDSPVTGYRIYRTETGAAEEPGVDVTTLSYQDKTVKPGTEYSWRIASVNSAGESAQSARVSRSSGVEAPGVVASFAAFPGNAQVLLRWRAPDVLGGANLSGYRILRDDQILTSLPPDAVQYTDTSVANDQTYTYQIKAYNVKGDGALSDPQRVTPAPVPSAPTSVVAETISAGSGTAVKVSWASGDADRYLVYRSSRAGIQGTLLQNLTSGTTSYVDNAVERGQTYYYTVESANVAGVSPPSSEVSASLVSKPGAPTNLIAFGQEGEIRVTWTPPTDTGDAPAGLLRYYVSRSTGSGASSIVKTDLDTTLFIDRLVTPGVNYTYRITTLNPIASDPSDPATAFARQVVNKPPVAVLAANPPLATAGDPVEIDASNSADVDGSIKSYLFDFGDTTEPVTTDKPTVSHSYVANGTYNATVIVTDNRGATNLAYAQVVVGEPLADKPPETGIGGGGGGGGRSPAAQPGSKTPGIPGPEPGLVVLVALSSALFARRLRR